MAEVSAAAGVAEVSMAADVFASVSGSAAMPATGSGDVTLSADPELSAGEEVPAETGSVAGVESESAAIPASGSGAVLFSPGAAAWSFTAADPVSGASAPAGAVTAGSAPAVAEVDSLITIGFEAGASDTPEASVAADAGGAVSVPAEVVPAEVEPDEVVPDEVEPDEVEPAEVEPAEVEPDEVVSADAVASVMVAVEADESEVSEESVLIGLAAGGTAPEPEGLRSRPTSHQAMRTPAIPRAR
ncbi:hypothetical protein JCM9534A_20740 [Catenuloplanes indicus JCM 9534]